MSFGLGLGLGLGLAMTGSLMTLVIGCQTTPTHKNAISSLDVIYFEDLPKLEHTDLHLGGFSGLVFEGISRFSGDLNFTTHTDRGPNEEVRKDTGAANLRPFVDPGFTPRWIQFSYKPGKRELSDVDQIRLVKQDGSPMTGLPNVANVDETAIDHSGHRIPVDKMGIDPEGLAKDADGSYWMCEEYRPSLLHFDKSGRLIQRWVPRESATGSGVPQLPHWYTKRQLNRGFEGIALDGDQVLGFLQSPLKDDYDVTRILSIDKSTGQPHAEYAYAFEPIEEGRAAIDKIGDAVRIGPGRFLVLEQNSVTDESGFHRIYEIEVNEASNLLNLGGAELSRSVLCMDGAPESTGALACVRPVKKKLVADLAMLGLHGFDKIEGLAVVDAQTLALVNDNDFDVTKNGRASAFFIVHLSVPLKVE
jgi:3-phytase